MYNINVNVCILSKRLLRFVYKILHNVYNYI